MRALQRRLLALTVALLGLSLLAAGCISETEGSTLRRRSVARNSAPNAAPAAPAPLEQAAAPVANGSALRLVAWNMEWLSEWKPASVTNWNRYPSAASMGWKRVSAASSRCVRQRNDGEQL